MRRFSPPEFNVPAQNVRAFVNEMTRLREARYAHERMTLTLIALFCALVFVGVVWKTEAPGDASFVLLSGCFAFLASYILLWYFLGFNEDVAYGSIKTYMEYVQWARDQNAYVRHEIKSARTYKDYERISDGLRFETEERDVEAGREPAVEQKCRCRDYCCC